MKRTTQSETVCNPKSATIPTNVARMTMTARMLSILTAMILLSVLMLISYLSPLGTYFWKSSGQNRGQIKVLNDDDASSLLPLCVYGEWGQSFNKLIELATLMSFRESPRQPIGLNDVFTLWYDDLIEPNPQLIIFPNYTGNCSQWFDAAFLFYHRPYGRNYSEFKELLPKVEYRRQAQEFLDALRNTATTASRSSSENVTVVTVHARRLNNDCVKQAHEMGPQCLTPEYHYRKYLTSHQVEDLCEVEYSIITDDFAKRDWNTTENPTIVLLATDSQNKTLDDTFPTILNLSFPVETWLMVISDVHYGNPMSTVDYGVAQWRHHLFGETDIRPRHCWVYEAAFEQERRAL